MKADRVAVISDVHGNAPALRAVLAAIAESDAELVVSLGDVTVTEACFAVGCTSLGSFSARFTELVGETPSAYRARNHDELRVVAPCQVMVVTRPRKERAEASSFEEAHTAAPA